MTAERDTVSVGSCPACGGPAQIIAGSGPALTASERARDAIRIAARIEPLGAAVDYRHVALPNIDEDLGGGWSLSTITYRRLPSSLGDWHAAADRRRESGGIDFEYGFGDSPSAAYLALRTAIEKRP